MRSQSWALGMQIPACSGVNSSAGSWEQPTPPFLGAWSVGGTILPQWRPIQGGRQESKAGGCRASPTLKTALPHSGWTSGLQADLEVGNRPRGHSAEEQLLLSKISLYVCVCVYTWCVCVCTHDLCACTWFVCVCVHIGAWICSPCKEYSSLCLHSPISQTLRELKLRGVGRCAY